MADPVFEYTNDNAFGLSDVGNGAHPAFADIDGDRDLDAFVGNSNEDTLFFRNTGTATNPAFAAAIANPFGLSGANPNFTDIDGDGDMDAFVGNYDGDTLFFRNTGTATNPTFASAIANPFGLSNIGNDASPTFVDIDGDGDMDTFISEYYGEINFFRNTGTTNSPVFSAAVNPFGSMNTFGSDEELAFTDIDGDGDLDAFVGSDYHDSNNEMDFYRNTGTITKPVFYHDSFDPFGLKSNGDPIPAFADIDDDGDADAFIGGNNGNTQFFTNSGSGYVPNFSFKSPGLEITSDFSRKNPTFADIDGDGDLDAFLGHGYSHDDSVSGNTDFFENRGTASNPDFAAGVTNPFGLNKVGNIASPTFVDIDKDSDLDAFIGNDAGNTLFFKNTGTGSSPVFASAVTNPFGLKDIGANARPEFADIDKDGDLDAFIGNEAGNTLFFKNTGTGSSPVFASAVTNPFGLKDIGSDAELDFVDIDGDGDLDAFLESSTSSTQQFFRNTGTAGSALFSTEDSPFELPDSGILLDIENRTYLDVDGDKDLDIFVTGVENTSIGPFSWENFLINNHAPNTANLNADEVYSKNTPLNLANIVVTDPDSPNITAILTLSNKAAGSLSTATSGTVTSTYNATTGVWTASGAIANVNTLLAGVTFNPASNFSGAFTINTSISDDSADPLLGSKNFSVMLASTPGNDILAGSSFSNDTVTYASATSPVTVSLLTTTQQNTVGAGLDTLTKVENLIGSAFNDNLTGDATYNVLDGKGGNDTLRGWSGADTMIGGLGNDTYSVENAKDMVTEKSSEGTDIVSSSINYTLPTNVENLILTGSSVINGIGNSQNNSITGNSAANELNGGAGNDTLDGGLGTNKLTGGTNNDIFKFTTKGHIDAITDYNVANDTVQLENAVFTALATTGTLAASQFRVGAQAVDANDFIIYNKTAGMLLYDADGNGTAAATQIATLSAGLGLTNADVVVI